VDEASKIHRQLGSLGEKIQNFFRKVIREVAQRDWEDAEKALYLQEIFVNTAYHYSGCHDRVFMTGNCFRI